MTMAPSLTLDQCVETLKGRLKGVSKAQPKELASLYLASLGLLCHLKQDAMLLHKARKATNESNSTPCPSPQEIPAMTRIHQDSQLFLSLVACLKVPEATESNTDSTAPRYSRKRSYSIQSESDYAPASKMLKLQHSPKKAVMSVPGARSADQSPDLPTMPVAILAATVLYTAFQHVDHWPAPLVQAYAEDSFGPRLWVDDERCSLLVQNLALCHTNLEEQQESDLDHAVLAQAAQVAHYYENLPLEGLTVNGHSVSPCPTALTPRPTNKGARSTSLASTGPLSAALPSDSDSDSDGEASCLIEVSSGLLARTGDEKADDSSSSSSSGMEGAEVVEMSTTIEQGPSRTASLASQSVVSAPNTVLAYPGLPAALNLTRIRRRYLGVNLEHAQKAIVTALSERLDVKSKQNSKLLMALPSFVCIPAIRKLTASHLERWLQSPALSGQARALFATTVQNMRNVDPPLPDDIAAIDSIMEMRLKANQLNMHIENVTEIAKRIPSVTVARHIFLRILREELAIMESGTQTPLPTEPMKLMNAVYGALPSGLACEGLAIAFLTLLAELAGKGEASCESQRERHLRVKKVRSLLRSVTNALASMFDGCSLIQSLLSFDVNAKSWSLEDEEDKARLMFECVTLLVPHSTAKESDMGPRGQQKSARRQSDEDNEEAINTLRTNLKKARKMLLDWCCTEYAQHWQARNREKTEHDQLVKKHVKREEKDEGVPVGARTPDYSSVFDGQGVSNKFAECLTVMRCVLFMNDADASALREFLYPGDSLEVSDPTWEDTKYRIQQCHEYGCDFDDEMLWIILKSASLQDRGIDPSLALPLIENLFECCSNDKRSVLQLTDPDLVWELYRLTEYFPFSTHTSNDMTEVSDHGENRSSVPRLAYPAEWWRVTVLVLIMCGTSPENIGQKMFSAIPTIRALIKMTTSGRYRFPTIDCDEAQFREMKAAEASMRDEECRVAELLFLPPVPAPKKYEASENGASSMHKRGIRASSRQREKQERLQRERREKEAAAALAEASRRRKVLRVAQKSIMLWEPKGLARKPPKEAVPLILSAEDLFCLSEIFQQSVNPDFLLLTIGQTTRGAIERAFDWVIPVISSVPEIINRLPANASCFLLLRAYGEEGEGKSELRQLSAPLVQHVRKSLIGEFGESSAVRAADLLLADLADPNPDRRRCVIRVLRETLSQLSTGGDDDSTGLLNLLRVDHIEAIVSGAINYISKGLAFERGTTLRSFVIALDRFISFATERKIAGQWKLAPIVCTLISSRQIVCAEAMDRFPDFRSLAITLVHREFLEYAANKGDTSGNSEDKALIQLYPSAGNDSANISVSMPLALLQSACVLLSICKDEEKSDLCTTTRAAIQYIADALLYPSIQTGEDIGDFAGLASATTISGDRAISAEQWVLLAKSRSDFIAKRAALSAPTLFLPRLLLCSGLPASSLLAMVDRLGKLGDKTEDRGLVYRDLFTPSVINQWATSYPGNRKEITRKLVGRLSAYLHSDEVPLENAFSSSFLEWLSEECSLQAKSKRSRPGKKAPKADQSVFRPLLNPSSGGGIVSMLGNLELVNDDVPELSVGSPIDVKLLTTSDPKEGGVIGKDVDANGILSFIERCRTENGSKELNNWLETVFRDKGVPAVGMENELSLDKVCNSLLSALFDTKDGEKGWFTSVVLEWVPQLSQLKGGPDLWKLVFSSQPSNQVAVELLRSRCALMWCQGHVQECQQWILANHGGLDVPAILRYLVATSRQQSIHAQSFIGSTPLSEEYWGMSESGLMAGVTIAIKGAREPCDFDINDPLNLPDWLVILLLLSRTGQQAMMRVCEMILAAIDQEQDAQVRSRLESAILRLYTYFPKRMKLGNPRLRGVLIEGAKSGHWLSWSSSLDTELDAMLSGLKGNPSKRIIQALMDLSKSHPLLILRKLPTLLQLLENDACVPKHRNVRGRVYGENPLGPLTATIAGKPIKVMIRHWGYSFSESLWISLLDVVMAVPKEVLFDCGLRMGLGELLGVYAKLLFIQCQLQSNPARVKNKYSDMLNEFKSTDRKGWEAWLETKQPDLPSLDTTRNVLMSCSLITPEASVEDLRRAMQS